MRNIDEIVAAGLAEEVETQAMTYSNFARLEALTYAVHCWCTEEGTSNEQDELLFVTGFRNDLQNASTSCGFT